MVGVVESARAIDASEERPGIAVWQNNGVGADQTIPHVHFHVAGTLPGGGTEWGDVDELSVAQTDQLAARLRPYLRIEALH
jgi:histidine triad (HIT) family protein